MNMLVKYGVFIFLVNKNTRSKRERKVGNEILIITNDCKTIRLLEFQYFKY